MRKRKAEQMARKNNPLFPAQAKRSDHIIHCHCRDHDRKYGDGIIAERGLTKKPMTVAEFHQLIGSYRRA